VNSSATDPGFVVLGNPGGRRVELFQAALAQLALPPARVVPWIDLLAGRAGLAGVVRPGDVVRIESPGKDFDVEKALLAAGAEADDPAGDFARADRAAVERLAFDKGRILWPRQWYLGFCRALGVVRRQLAACPPHRVMNDLDDIGVMFDKGRCHARLAAAGVPVAPALGPVRSFNELVERMEQARCRRVFVKLAHGSSASGVVAYQTNGRLHQATTMVEVVREGDDLRLYNSRQVRVYRGLHEIAPLVDELCRHHVHVERWLPKAGVGGRSFDLRVVTIAGRARHTVVRTSRTPMTNLNERGDAGAVRERTGDGGWERAMQTCERAAACFPRSLYAGIDLLIESGYRKHAVLEVNAFGDLLPGVTCGGMETYAAEVAAVLGCSVGAAAP
jgi:hypothetical protein